MNWFELGWMVVCFIVFGCIFLSILSVIIGQIGGIYNATLYGAKEAAIREYASSLRRQSYWFHGRDKAVIEAVSMEMEQGLSYARADQIRDKHLPQTIEQNKN